MKTLKTIWRTLGPENGIIHLLGIFALIYDCLYWQHSEYANNTELFPSVMIASLNSIKFGQQIFIYLFGASCLAFFIEVVEGFAGAVLSKWDIFWSFVGAVLAIIWYYKFAPQNTYWAIYSAIIIGINILFILRFLWKVWLSKITIKISLIP